MSWQYEILASGKLGCNGCIVWNPVSRRAVVVDPTDDAEPIIAFARDEQLAVESILLTHGHFDHSADTERAMRAFGCRASLHPNDEALYRRVSAQGARFGFKLATPTEPLAPLHDGQRLDLEAGFELNVLHVPGHSPGSVAFHAAALGCVFVGDTLFHGSVGRTDLPGGSALALAQSIRTRLYTLPDDTTVIPGHGLPTTIGREKRHNPYVRPAEVSVPRSLL